MSLLHEMKMLFKYTVISVQGGSRQCLVAHSDSDTVLQWFEKGQNGKVKKM